MNARTKQFWKFQGLFWLAAGSALFISGLSQMPAAEALVRNLFLLVAGFLTSFSLAMVIDELRWLEIIRLRIASYVLAYFVALFCVVVINAITYTMRGLAFGDIGFGQWAAGALNLGLVYAFWSELFIQQVYQPPAAQADDRPERIVVEHRGNLVPLQTAAIESVTAAGDYVEIRCGGRTYLDRQTLGAVESRLGDGFVRVHRSALVNRVLVASVTPLQRGRFRFNFASGGAIESSRGYRATVEVEFFT